MHGGEREQRMFDVVAGQNGDRPIGRQIALNSAAAIACTAASVSAYVIVRQPPAASRCARKTRCGATLAQCPSRSVSFCGCGGNGCGERIRIAPSARRSTTTSAGPSFTGRSGGGFAATSLRCVCRRARHVSFAPLWGALFQERLEPRLGFVVALRNRRGQRFGDIAGGGIAAGDARQHLHHREIRKRRIAGDAVREFDALGEAFAFVDQILREPDAWPSSAESVRPVSIMSITRAAPISGGSRTEPPPPTIDAAAGLGQRVKGGAFGHPHMRRGGEFEPAADHRALQHGNHGTGPNSMASKARCQDRECSTPEKYRAR